MERYEGDTGNTVNQEEEAKKEERRRHSRWYFFSTSAISSSAVNVGFLRLLACSRVMIVLNAQSQRVKKGCLKEERARQ
jgi:hypothetical protein